VKQLLPYLSALLSLARWHSALGAGLAVWVGGHIAGATWAWWWLYPMSIAVLLSAAGNAYNDAGDVEADQINRPTRPIPRGAITILQARTVAFISGVLALLLAIPLGWITVAGTVAGLLLLFLYTPYLKSVPLVGNGVVGSLVGMCIGFGGLMGGDVPAVILPGVAVGLLFGGREVLKTLYDVAGDQQSGTVTIATRWGDRVALSVATICFGIAILLLALWTGTTNFRWLIPLFALVLVASILIPLWQQPIASHAIKFALNWSKILGLILLALLTVF
jgi:geranylgeranylglycerol-phosphate geranylgeranyltransferase